MIEKCMSVTSIWTNEPRFCVITSWISLDILANAFRLQAFCYVRTWYRLGQHKYLLMQLLNMLCIIYLPIHNFPGIIQTYGNFSQMKAIVKMMWKRSENGDWNMRDMNWKSKAKVIQGVWFELQIHLKATTKITCLHKNIMEKAQVQNMKKVKLKSFHFYTIPYLQINSLKVTKKLYTAQPINR